MIGANWGHSQTQTSIFHLQCLRFRFAPPECESFHRAMGQEQALVSKIHVLLFFFFFSHGCVDSTNSNWALSLLFSRICSVSRTFPGDTSWRFILSGVLYFFVRSVRRYEQQLQHDAVCSPFLTPLLTKHEIKKKKKKICLFVRPCVRAFATKFSGETELVSKKIPGEGEQQKQRTNAARLHHCS